MDKPRTCIVCIAKNEDRTIQEWLSYNMKLGFDKIFLYQNDWNCNIEMDGLKKLRLDGPSKQMTAYNNWLSSKYRNRFGWAAFIDCDEFIVLHKHKTISDFLSEFDVNETVGISPNWFLFGSGGQEFPTSNPESLIKRFTFRNKNANKHVKTILNLKIESKMSYPHSPNKPTIDTNHKQISGPFNPNGPTNVIQINHYYHKSKQEWIEKISRGRADSDLLSHQRTMEMWEQSIHNNHDVEDLTALNFLYEKNNVNLNMNHIYKLPQFGEHWFSYKKFYKSMVEKFPSGSKFVEVGSWKGKSSAYLAVEIINSKKDITLDCVDTWKGSAEHKTDKYVKSNSLYELFIENTSSLSSVINPIRLDSVSASKKHEDNSIDFVFIDASHEYDYVKKDIEAWFPKVKIGGVIAGHDYKNGWIGVDKAVDEFFINKKFVVSQSCWIYEK